MVGNGLRVLWAEPRPAPAPRRVRRDWVLVGVIVAWAIMEGVLRTDLVWRPAAIMLGVVVALSLLWRRTHPLGAVAAAFGSLAAVDVATILAAGEPTGPWSVSVVLLLPYALFRWGSGREATVGLLIILGWLPLSFTANVVEDPAEVVAGYGFFLLSAAIGASVRYHATSRIRDIEQAKLREREQLARELHDTIAHQISMIAVQAQAGRAIAESDPDGAMATLEVIETAASRTLTEMRTMVGILRRKA